VIKIEISLEESELLEKKESTNDFQINDIISMSREKNIEKIFEKYNNQIDYIAQNIEDSVNDIEEEIVKKWKLKSNLYITDTDKPLGAYLYNKMGDKYFYAVDILEMGDKDFLNNIKNEIIKNFKTELNKYEKKYNIKSNNIEDIEKDIEKLVNKNITQKFADMFNNDIRDELESLCNKWDENYAKKNYSKVDELTTQILEFCDKPIIYKDDKLENRVEKIIAKNQIIQNKIKSGKNGEISELEDEILNKLIKEPYVGERSNELQNNINKYKKLSSRENLLNEEELEELNKTKEIIKKQANPNDDYVYDLLDNGESIEKLNSELDEILKELEN
jgi:hypothetical protein